jgi:hypothetical protein
MCLTAFSKFWSMTIFIPAENTRHSEKPEQNSDQFIHETGQKPFFIFN